MCIAYSIMWIVTTMVRSVMYKWFQPQFKLTVVSYILYKSYTHIHAYVFMYVCVCVCDVSS